MALDAMANEDAIVRRAIETGRFTVTDVKTYRQLVTDLETALMADEQSMVLSAAKKLRDFLAPHADRTMTFEDVIKRLEQEPA